VLKDKRAVARSKGKEGELGNQNKKAERVRIVKTAEESNNS
jgi:hypothetical protein